MTPERIIFNAFEIALIFVGLVVLGLMSAFRTIDKKYGEESR